MKVTDFATGLSQFGVRCSIVQPARYSPLFVKINISELDDGEVEALFKKVRADITETNKKGSAPIAVDPSVIQKVKSSFLLNRDLFGKQYTETALRSVMRSIREFVGQKQEAKAQARRDEAARRKEELENLTAAQLKKELLPCAEQLEAALGFKLAAHYDALLKENVVVLQDFVPSDRRTEFATKFTTLMHAHGVPLDIDRADEKGYLVLNIKNPAKLIASLEGIGTKIHCAVPLTLARGCGPGLWAPNP